MHIATTTNPGRAMTDGACRDARGYPRAGWGPVWGAAAIAVWLTAALASSPAVAQVQDAARDDGRETTTGIGSDIKAYLTAPLHGDGSQWVRFGAVFGGVVAAYHYDDRVRRHFVSTAGPQPANTHDMQAAIPAALALGGTWIAAALSDNADGRHEARSMFEAAALSSGAAFAIKTISGRTRPYQTGDSADWRNGGDSFPSMHTTAAFAIGTVLAESGSDRFRWMRRVIGYGLAAGTAYARMKYDAHWLSDNVAAAGLGVATARFVMQRHDHDSGRARFAVAPVGAGLSLSYTVALQR